MTEETDDELDLNPAIEMEHASGNGHGPIDEDGEEELPDPEDLVKLPFQTLMNIERRLGVLQSIEERLNVMEGQFGYSIPPSSPLLTPTGVATPTGRSMPTGHATPLGPPLGPPLGGHVFPGGSLVNVLMPPRQMMKPVPDEYTIFMNRVADGVKTLRDQGVSADKAAELAVAAAEKLVLGMNMARRTVVHGGNVGADGGPSLPFLGLAQRMGATILGGG